MIALWAVYLRGLLILYKRRGRILLGLVVSPLLFAVAFGWGLGQEVTVEGVSYLRFMIPGLLALSGMVQSFGVGTELNIARFFNKVFEEFLLAPTGAYSICCGLVLYGMTRGLLSFFVILGIAALTGTASGFSLFILVPVLLNCFLFASLGVFVALILKAHRDMGFFTTFVITPMSFLSNTFFSLRKLPDFLVVLTKIIPLTHASITIRGVFLGYSVPVYHYLILIGYGALFFLLAVQQVHRAVE